MDLNRFTEKAQGTITNLQNIATRSQHQTVDVDYVALVSGLVNRQGIFISNWRA